MTGDSGTMDVLIDGERQTLPEAEARALIEAGRAAPYRVTIQVHDVRTTPVAEYGKS